MISASINTRRRESDDRSDIQYSVDGFCDIRHSDIKSSTESTWIYREELRLISELPHDESDISRWCDNNCFLHNICSICDTCPLDRKATPSARDFASYTDTILDRESCTSCSCIGSSGNECSDSWKYRVIYDIIGRIERCAISSSEVFRFWEIRILSQVPVHIVIEFFYSMRRGESDSICTVIYRYTCIGSYGCLIRDSDIWINRLIWKVEKLKSIMTWDRYKIRDSDTREPHTCCLSVCIWLTCKSESKISWIAIRIRDRKVYRIPYIRSCSRTSERDRSDTISSDSESRRIGCTIICIILTFSEKSQSLIRECVYLIAVDIRLCWIPRIEAEWWKWIDEESIISLLFSSSNVSFLKSHIIILIAYKIWELWSYIHEICRTTSKYKSTTSCCCIGIILE